MTLSNKRVGQDDHIDRISGLPCNAIDGILANLDIKDLVGTSILSKQWRYKWTKAPRLWFSDDFFKEYEDLDDPVAYKIITDVLKQHEGPIDKFGLFISYADIIPPKLLKSSFSSIKYLKLYGLNLSDRGELLYIVSVLESAHSLVELECYSDEDISQEPDDLEELECTGGCLSRLMKVTIDVRSCSQNVMSLIEFILANSASLEALTFKVGRQYPKLDAPILLSISEELLWMRRASQKAHIMFYY